MVRFSARLHLGIVDIDDQHGEMVEQINAIAAMVKEHQHTNGHRLSLQDQPESDCCKKIRLLLNGLVDQTVLHFQTEEQLMEESGYPRLPEHRYEHKMLLAELKLFVRSVCAGSECLKPQDIDSLGHWLVGHIVLDDKEMARYLAEQISRQPSQPNRQATLQPLY